MVTVITSTIGATGDYATLELWETGQKGDLVAGDIIERAAVQNQLLDSVVNLNSTMWVTDATRYIHFDADTGAEHDGTPGSGARIIESGGVSVLFISSSTANDILVTNLELGTSAPGASQRGIRSGASGSSLRVDRCIIHGFSVGGSSRGIENTSANDLTCLNSVIFDCSDAGILLSAGVQNDVIYNTVIWVDAVGADALIISGVSDGSDKDVDLRNCLLHGESEAINANFPTANKWNAGCDQNIVNDGTATIEGLKGDFVENATFQAGTGGAGTRVMFENLTGGSEDLRLVLPATPADNAALDFGNNLTAETFPDMDITSDITSTTRPAAGSWDAGAHQKTVAVALPTLAPAYGVVHVAGTLPAAYGVVASGTLPPAYPPVV